MIVFKSLYCIWARKQPMTLGTGEVSYCSLLWNLISSLPQLNHNWTEKLGLTHPLPTNQELNVGNISAVIDKTTITTTKSRLSMTQFWPTFKDRFLVSITTTSMTTIKPKTTTTTTFLGFDSIELNLICEFEM